MPESRVAALCRLLNAEDARYLLVGASAMQLWGSTRATRDIDILTRAWNLRWPEAAASVVVFEVDGVDVPTVTIPNLIASKRTGRLQDTADIQVLEELLRRMDGDA